MVRKRILRLIRIMANPRFAVIAAASALLLIAIYAVSANVLIWGTLNPNPFANPLTILLLGICAIGSGLLLAVIVYGHSHARVCASGIAGSSLGFLSSACPYCPPLLAYFAGAQSLYVLSAYGPLFAAGAVVMVYFGLYQSLSGAVV